MFFHWTLNDSKSPRVSRTLLSILVGVNNATVWIVSPRVLLSNFPVPVPVLWWLYSAHRLQLVSPSFPCSNFFQFSSKVQVPISFPAFFNFTQWSAGTAKSRIRQVLFFYWLLVGLVIWPRLCEPFVSQDPKEFCASHSPGQILGCACTIC